MWNEAYGENVQIICRVCGAADQTVVYVVSEYSKLVRKEYKEMIHDNVTKMLYWKLREKWGFNKAEKWYIHKPDKVLESEESKILWGFPIQTDKNLEHNRPDVTVIDNKSKKFPLIDTTCLSDTRIEKKEEEKCTDHSDLRYEVWKCKNLENEKGRRRRKMHRS